MSVDPGNAQNSTVVLRLNQEGCLCCCKATKGHVIAAESWFVSSRYPDRILKILKCPHFCTKMWLLGSFLVFAAMRSGHARAFEPLLWHPYTGFSHAVIFAAFSATLRASNPTCIGSIARSKWRYGSDPYHGDARARRHHPNNSSKPMVLNRYSITPNALSLRFRTRGR